MSKPKEVIQKAKEIKSKLKDYSKSLPDMIVDGYSKNKEVMCQISGELIVKELTVSKDLLKQDKAAIEQSLIEAVNKALKDIQAKVNGQLNGLIEGAKDE